VSTPSPPRRGPHPRPPIPTFLQHLPIRRGLPVPWVASWSSEGQSTVRYDPLVGRVAYFTKGRPGRGTPVFGVMNAERQRRAVLHGVCQICGDEIHEHGFLPNHPGLVETTDNHGGQYLIEPPCCEPCARWAALGCPGIAGTVTDLLEIGEIQPLLQLVDIRDFEGRQAQRFDRQETPESLARLGRIMDRYPEGIVAYVRYQVIQERKHEL